MCISAFRTHYVPNKRVDIGANASAEGGDDELEDGVETVNDVVHSFRLQTTSFNKKDYVTHIKGGS